MQAGGPAARPGRARRHGASGAGAGARLAHRPPGTGPGSCDALRCPPSGPGGDSAVAAQPRPLRAADVAADALAELRECVRIGLAREPLERPTQIVEPLSAEIPAPQDFGPEPAEP